MGIYIYMSIAGSVKKAQWEAVYDEVMTVADQLPFIDIEQKEIQGVEVQCLTKSKSEKKDWGYYKDKTVWITCGDSKSLKIAEDYRLVRDMVEEEPETEEITDAAALDGSYRLWGNKSQGEPYHIYLLGLACLIEARLGIQAFTFGDITYGQCQNAVDIINSILDEPIGLPDSCYADRFAKRISAISSIDDEEKLKCFFDFFLGAKDADFGAALRNNFSSDALDAYWRHRFDSYELTMLGSHKAIHEYLSLGFDLSHLCDLIDFSCKKDESDSDKNKPDPYDAFVDFIMKTRMHRKEKKLDDHLQIDTSEGGTYSVYTILAQFAFAGVHNYKVDRYIPLERIREILKEKIGEKCDVDSLIEKGLKELEEDRKKVLEEFSESTAEIGVDISEVDDVSDVFNLIMEKQVANTEEEEEAYDITKLEHLKYYKPGDTVSDDIKEYLQTCLKTWDSWCKEENYETVNAYPKKEKCKWMVTQASSLYLTEECWERIFSRVLTDDAAFRRYFPIFYCKINSEGVRALVTAMLMNDDLYAYARTLEDVNAIG